MVAHVVPMKIYLKVIIGIVAFLVIAGAIILMTTNSPQYTNTNPNATATPKPTETTTPMETPTPTATATPKPTESPSSTTNIAISYNIQTAQSVTNQNGYTTTPVSGNVFLEVNMTIRNNGYKSNFNTNPSYFNLVADNIQYSYDIATYELGKWNTVGVVDGGTYEGILVFQVPQSSTSFTLGYEASYSSFNIIWTKT